MSESVRQPVIDGDKLGRRMRAARILAGFDSVNDTVEALADQLGVKMSARALYAVERGQHGMTLEQYVALIHILKPPGGWAFFQEAFHPDIVDAWARDVQIASAVFREEAARGKP